MPLKLDRQMREQITHDAAAFPIAFFEGELGAVPNRRDRCIGALNLK